MGSRTDSASIAPRTIEAVETTSGKPIASFARKPSGDGKRDGMLLIREGQREGSSRTSGRESRQGG